MAKERILIRKIAKLNELKLELVSRSERSKEEIVDDIKDNVEELELVLEDFDYINTVEDTKIKLDCSTEEYRNLSQFTLDSLQKYNGLNGNPAYVAIEDKVYDVTNTEYWRDKEKYNATAGNNITRTYTRYKSKQNSIFEEAKLVGTLNSD